MPMSNDPDDYWNPRTRVQIEHEIANLEYWLAYGVCSGRTRQALEERLRRDRLERAQLILRGLQHEGMGTQDSR